VAAAAEMLREAGILDDNRATGGEITAAPVAKPAGIQPDVLVFGDGEFAFRTADVIRGRGDSPR